MPDRLPKPAEYRTLELALRALRREAGLTQRDAGKLAGIRSNFLSQVELGKRGITLADELDLAGGIEG